MKTSEKETNLLKAFAENGVSDDLVLSYGRLSYDLGTVDSTIEEIPAYERYCAILTEAVDAMDEGIKCSCSYTAGEHYLHALNILSELDVKFRNEIRFRHHLSHIDD